MNEAQHLQKEALQAIRKASEIIKECEQLLLDGTEPDGLLEALQEVVWDTTQAMVAVGKSLMQE